jgi:hypothetical protein
LGGLVFIWRRQGRLAAPIHQPGLALFLYKNSLFHFMIFESYLCIAKEKNMLIPRPPNNAFYKLYIGVLMQVVSHQIAITA